MKEFYSWTQLKELSSIKHIPIQYSETNTKYIVYLIEDGHKFFTEIYKSNSNIKGIDIEQNTSDRTDFENNYKTDANLPIKPRSDDAKEIVRAESRPIDFTTVFTCRADAPSDIGKGKKLFWDFSTQDDELQVPSGSGIKKKRIEFKFIDYINIKEGAIYFHKAKKGSFIDMYVVCPVGNYYLDNNGSPVLAEEDIIIKHYVNNHFIQGDCPMGDELNTESCSTSVPPNYKFWVEITVPQEDNESNGYISLELYRKNTLTL